MIKKYYGIFFSLCFSHTDGVSRILDFWDCRVINNLLEENFPDFVSQPQDVEGI